MHPGTEITGTDITVTESTTSKSAGSERTASARTVAERTVAEHHFRAMNTDVHVVIVGGDADDLAAAEAGVRQREARWSRFLPDSELSRINAGAGRPVMVSSDTFDLVARSIDAHHLTDGAFDPTVLACLLAAGYDRSFELLETAHGRTAPGRPGGPVPPAPGPHDIELHPATSAVVVPPGVGLDLGGIAKGATADALVHDLMAGGVAGCCVNIGGDVRVAGQPPDDRGWLIELAYPGPVTSRLVALGAGAVCTSSISKRQWPSRSEGGASEHHLRDPRSGAAVDNGLAAVTVMAASATQAEVLTKVAFVAGADVAADRLGRFGVTGLLVLPDASVVELPGFDAFAPRTRE